MTGTPSISFIGIIGKANNPLHIALFPTSTAPSAIPTTNPQQLPKQHYLLTPLSTSLLLSTTLDIFESRARSLSQSQPLNPDYGLLKNVDERLSLYGWETNTGVKFVVGVDIYGRSPSPDGRGQRGSGGNGGLGVREAEVRIAFQAIQKAYVALLQNPFYDPDEHSPATGRGGKKIESRKFTGEIRRIGENWRVGLTTL